MPSPAASTASWQGPLRLAVAIFVVGVLVVWLITPIGNACPDLGTLPPGSSASSSPSFSPPFTRTCTYATDGVKATVRYVPVLDWIVLLLVAGVAGGAAAALSPGRRAEARATPQAPRERRPPRDPRPPRAERADRGEGVFRVSQRGAPQPGTPPDEQPRPARGRAPREAPGTGERDAAERERARRERAERARRGR